MNMMLARECSPSSWIHLHGNIRTQRLEKFSFFRSLECSQETVSSVISETSSPPSIARVHLGEWRYNDKNTQLLSTRRTILFYFNASFSFSSVHRNINSNNNNEYVELSPHQVGDDLNKLATFLHINLNLNNKSSVLTSNRTSSSVTTIAVLCCPSLRFSFFPLDNRCSECFCRILRCTW